MATQHLHPLVRQWFESRFGTPTEAQAQGWPAIAAGQHTLIAAPTGSGKTLAAFLTALDSLVRQALEPAQDSETGGLPDATQVVYVSPLKALANDIQRNLPLAQIQALAEGQGTPLPEIRVAVRTGDTPAKERSLHAKHPPHVLITTPESLFILLTSERGRKALKSTRTLILDELHALVPNKRGAHLALSVERLCHLAEQPITRIGLSATQKPVETVARFLTGTPVAVSVNAEEPEESPSFRRKPESRDVSRAPASAMADAAGLGEGLVPVRGEALEPRTKVGPQSFVRPSRTSGRTEEGAAPPTGQEEGVADAVACTIVDIGHRRAMDVAIELPDGFELGPIATHELWAQVLDQI
ncbi:MAG: DEAD/DEAH box helicase, partial [Dehalococcoidia bacterium]